MIQDMYPPSGQDENDDILSSAEGDLHMELITFLVLITVASVL